MCPSGTQTSVILLRRRKETGRILLGEGSKVNDDRADNRFPESAGRFPASEEDEKPLHLLCGDDMEQL